MIVYLVTADTYKDDYGSSIVCFGVTESEYELNIIIDSVISQGYCPDITKLETGVIVDKYLGGYIE